jgi:hypothetical protein
MKVTRIFVDALGAEMMELAELDGSGTAHAFVTRCARKPREGKMVADHRDEAAPVLDLSRPKEATRRVSPLENPCRRARRTGKGNLLVPADCPDALPPVRRLPTEEVEPLSPVMLPVEHPSPLAPAKLPVQKIGPLNAAFHVLPFAAPVPRLTHPIDAVQNMGTKFFAGAEQSQTGSLANAPNSGAV